MLQKNEPHPLSFLYVDNFMIPTETPPVSDLGSPTTPMEKYFWEYASAYEGMKELDMEKSSHGRAFVAGWGSATKYLKEAK